MEKNLRTLLFQEKFASFTIILPKERMQKGIEIAERVLSAPRYPFAVIKPSLIPADPGVYSIRLQDSDETLYASSHDGCLPSSEIEIPGSLRA